MACVLTDEAEPVLPVGSALAVVYSERMGLRFLVMALSSLCLLYSSFSGHF